MYCLLLSFLVLWYFCNLPGLFTQWNKEVTNPNSSKNPILKTKLRFYNSKHWSIQLFCSIENTLLIVLIIYCFNKSLIWCAHLTPEIENDIWAQLLSHFIVAKKERKKFQKRISLWNTYLRRPRCWFSGFVWVEFYCGLN